MSEINRYFGLKTAVIYVLICVLMAAVLFHIPASDAKRGSSGKQLNHAMISMRISAPSAPASAKSEIEPTPVLEQVLPISPKPSPKKAAKKPNKKPSKKPQKTAVKKLENKLENKIDENSQADSNSPAAIASSVESHEAANSLGDEMSKSHVADYQSIIKGILNRYKRYPKKAKILGKSGVVKISATLDASGRLIDFKILQANDFESFNQEAKALFERIKHFPAPPKELLNAGVFSFNMPIVFSLRK